MKDRGEYLVGGDQETLRLDVKTDVKTAQKQALWVGFKSGVHDT